MYQQVASTEIYVKKTAPNQTQTNKNPTSSEVNKQPYGFVSIFRDNREFSFFSRQPAIFAGSKLIKQERATGFYHLSNGAVIFTYSSSLKCCSCDSYVIVIRIATRIDNVFHVPCLPAQALPCLVG